MTVSLRLHDMPHAAALAAGWDPVSRGRAMVFMVDANGDQGSFFEPSTSKLEN